MIFPRRIKYNIPPVIHSIRGQTVHWSTSRSMALIPQDDYKDNYIQREKNNKNKTLPPSTSTETTKLAKKKLINLQRFS